MKTYAVCINHGAGTVVLRAYESKAVDAGVATFQMIAGNHASVYHTSTRKKDALDFIKKNCPDSEGWVIYDNADLTYEQYVYGRNWKNFC